VQAKEIGSDLTRMLRSGGGFAGTGAGSSMSLPNTPKSGTKSPRHSMSMSTDRRGATRRSPSKRWSPRQSPRHSHSHGHGGSEDGSFSAHGGSFMDAHRRAANNDELSNHDQFILQDIMRQELADMEAEAQEERDRAAW
jgi:hypothetical protein